MDNDFENSFVKKSNEDRLQNYENVNQCETLEQLSKIILELADEDGMIQGRFNKFDAKRMSDRCLKFNSYAPNVLTREYGIRQQAMYISYYNSVE